MEKDILKTIYENIENGNPTALITVTSVSGSTSCRTGSIMGVFKNGDTLGTIGGGKIEFQIINKALECLKKNENGKFEFSPSEEFNSCTGKVSCFIKVFSLPSKLILVGGGHVSLYIHKLAKILNFYTVIIDDREQFANKERFPDGDEIILDKVDKALCEYPIDKNTYIIISGKNHENDCLALENVVSKKAAYIGMIGSSKKVSYIMNKLISKGIEKENLKKVFAPIGLNIASQNPEEIALGILSEVLLIKNSGSLNHIKDLKNIDF